VQFGKQAEEELEPTMTNYKPGEIIKTPPTKAQLHDIWSQTPYASPNAMYAPTVI